MTSSRTRAILSLALWILTVSPGCAGVHDRQVLNPQRDWRLSENRRERVAKLKAPFVTLGNRLKSLGEPTEHPPLLGPATSSDWAEPPLDATP